MLIKQTKFRTAISGPGINEMRFGELSNGKKLSSGLVTRSDPKKAEIAVTEAVINEIAVLDKVTDGFTGVITVS
jgi:hypothetical protein